MNIESLPIYSREALRVHLSKFGIKAEKGLGQHFLASEDAVLKIVQAVGPVTSVLEIGPGPGILTRPLTSRYHVTAVEIDRAVTRALNAAAPEVNLIPGDALELDLAEILNGLEAPRALVSNIPYYITGPLLARFAEVRHLYDVAILMVQKEVAERIIAPADSSERGALSVGIQLQFDVEWITNVKGEEFLPPPKVDSSVIKLIPRPARPDEAALMKLVHLGFAQRRKTLANNLVNAYKKPRAEIEALLAEAGIDEIARAQEVDEAQWIRLNELITQG